MSLSVIWRNFALNSSTHGIQQISSREGRIKKAFWILATTGAVVALLTNLVIQVEKYFSYPVNVEMAIQHSNDLEFPAITICNMNPVKKSKLQELTRKKRSAETARCCCFCCRSNDSTKDENSCSTCESQKCGLQSTESFHSSSSVATVGTTTATVLSETVTVDRTTLGTETSTAESFVQEPGNKEEFKKAEQLTEMISRLNLQERIDLGFTLNDLILSCTYAGSNCNPDDFVLVHNPLHGNCFTFNSGWNNRSHLRSFRTGRRYGLLMTLNVNQDDYVFEAGDTAGLRILIHPGHQMPFPEDQGLIVSSGVSTSISMQKVMVERLGGAYSSCIDIDDTQSSSLSNVYQEQFPETRYSQEACTRTCYQNHLIESCRCADPQYPRPEGELVSVCDSADEDQVECKRNVSKDFNSEIINCDCPVSCKLQSISPVCILTKTPSSRSRK